MRKTKIEWCDSTLNPVMGCTYGCEYCYARRMNDRFKWIEDFSKPQFFPIRLGLLKSRIPKRIFMNSMSDIADWKDEWWDEVFKAIKENPQHKYLFLTKRLKAYKDIRYPKNVWLGNTITKQKDFTWEIGRPCGAKRFYSIEPILEPIRLPINNIPKKNVEWVIVGAETGNRKDKVIPEKEWIDGIVTQCRELNIPVFMKDSLVPIMGEENMLREFPVGLKE